MLRFSRSVALLALLILAQPCLGQGLLFSLPPDGSWIQYEGEVKQIDQRPDPETGQLKTAAELKWIRHVRIQSVGQETAEFRGTQQPCRWIEISVRTGVQSEEGLDPGIVGTRVYKVLVPESVIDGKGRDPKGVPVDMLPIIKGFKKFGRTGEVRPIRAPAIRIYPQLSLLGQYADPKVELVSGNPGAPLKAVNGKQYSGSMTMERRTSRLKNTAKYWISEEVPFGLVSWEVNLTREAKNITDPRSAFSQVSLVEVKMAAAQEGNDAEAIIQEK